MYSHDALLLEFTQCLGKHIPQKDNDSHQQLLYKAMRSLGLVQVYMVFLACIYHQS